MKKEINPKLYYPFSVKPLKIIDYTGFKKQKDCDYYMKEKGLYNGELRIPVKGDRIMRTLKIKGGGKI